jgi:hypothetical protein
MGTLLEKGEINVSQLKMGLTAGKWMVNASRWAMAIHQPFTCISSSCKPQSGSIELGKAARPAL